MICSVLLVLERLSTSSAVTCTAFAPEPAQLEDFEIGERMAGEAERVEVQRLVIVRELQRIRAAAAVDAPVETVVNEDVVAGAAEHHIDTTGAVQRIVTEPADQRIVTSGPVEGVIARRALIPPRRGNRGRRSRSWRRIARRWGRQRKPRQSSLHSHHR